LDFGTRRRSAHPQERRASLPEQRGLAARTVSGRLIGACLTPVAHKPTSNSTLYKLIWAFCTVFAPVAYAHFHLGQILLSVLFVNEVGCGQRTPPLRPFDRHPQLRGSTGPLEGVLMQPWRMRRGSGAKLEMNPLAALPDNHALIAVLNS
jgi:hypothetical protein